MLGDPFTPFVPDPKTGNLKVRGTLRDGYTYREVVRLIFGEPSGKRSVSVECLCELDDSQRTDVRVLFEGTAYEQGKTGGFHRREIALPPFGVSLLSDPDPVHEVHGIMLERVTVAKNALRGASRILLAGTLKPRQGDDGKTSAPARELEHQIDVEYFDQLFASVQRRISGEEQWLHPWLEWLAHQAERAFDVMREQMPSSTGRRLQRLVEAESYLGYKLWELRGGRKNTGEFAPEAMVDTELVKEEVA